MSAAISDLSPARYLGELRLEEDIIQAVQSDPPAPLEEVSFREETSIFVEHQSPDMEWTEVLSVAGRGASPEAGMAAGPVRVCVAVGRDNLRPGASFYLVFIIF